MWITASTGVVLYVLKAYEEVEWTLEVCKDGELIAAVRKTFSAKKPKK